MKTYRLDEDTLSKLLSISTQLHGGSDRERDYGHRVWLAIKEFVEVEPSPKPVTVTPSPKLVTVTMSDAGSLFAAALYDASVSKALDGGIIDLEGLPHPDLIQDYLEGKINSVTAIYMAMERAR
jgi:hypothetical protein